jgi:CheY-like chemotaxis protein
VAQILLVEDEAIARLHISEFLRSEGYSVDAVASGEEALQELHSQTYDVVVTDHKLPGKSTGIDVLTEFERITPGRQKIVLSAYPSYEIGSESVGATHLTKPVNLDDLLQKLKASSAVTS